MHRHYYFEKHVKIRFSLYWRPTHRYRVMTIIFFSLNLFLKFYNTSCGLQSDRLTHIPPLGKNTHAVINASHSNGSVLGKAQVTDNSSDMFVFILTGFGVSIMPLLPGMPRTLRFPAFVTVPARARLPRHIIQCWRDSMKIGCNFDMGRVK